MIDEILQGSASKNMVHSPKPPRNIVTSAL